MFDPRIEKHLISDQGERVVDEVRKHWAATVSAVLELFLGTVVALLSFWVPPQAWWVPALLGGLVVAHAVWRFFEQHLDRFVITNMRVFRVHGILSQRIATMPLARILDISVHKPVVGRIFGYGHFVFESAAQEQGLREIRYVGDPDERGLTIQRVIQQAGLRGAAGRGDPYAGTPLPPPAVAVVEPETPRASGDTAPVPDLARPASPSGWDWLAEAQRREDERLAELRGEPRPAVTPFDPDRTSTAPIDLPR
jgi:membrane protein YdbS with pleckstrin-like domain